MDKTTITDDRHSLLARAVALHQKGQLQAALTIYQQLLAEDPTDFDALHFSGVVARQSGDPQRGVMQISLAMQSLQQKGILPGMAHAAACSNLAGCYQDCADLASAERFWRLAIALRPDYAIACNNLGNLLKQQGRYADALAAFDDALRFSPDNPEVLFNAGLTLYQDRQFPQSLDLLTRALANHPNRAPVLCARSAVWLELNQPDRATEDSTSALALHDDYAEAYVNRAIARRRLNQQDECISDLTSAVRYRPGYGKAWLLLGHALHTKGDDATAADAYRRAREAGADVDQVDFTLAAMGVAPTPAAAPAGYVRNLFDQYADHFDEHLVNVLHYDMPRAIADLINRHRHDRLLHVLDLGCGTGLCAQYLRQMATSLTGVDLSQRMLDRAAALGLYDALACAEITRFLSDSDSCYDGIVAADVLVYFGDLGALLIDVRKQLAPGGLFCFSLEYWSAAAETQHYQLHASCRYRHSEHYIRSALHVAGFDLVALQHQTGRRENMADVAAMLILAKNAIPSSPG